MCVYMLYIYTVLCYYIYADLRGMGISVYVAKSIAYRPTPRSDGGISIFVQQLVTSRTIN